MLNGYPVFAGETVLNTAISVTIPEPQSGNPGDFLTYVLSFQNRSSTPLDLEVEYLSGPDWDVIGDTSLTIPANTGAYYFPVTVMIPQNAPANLTKKIELRFKLIGEAFPLPTVNIRVLVNPVSAINFSVPPPQSGTNGSTVNYTLTVTNSGNTVEHFSAKAVSENNWPVRLEPTFFELRPGESRQILITHQIPGYSETDYDQVKVQFSWGNRQKVILLSTSITDKLAKMADRYYIWQGQLAFSHPNLTDPDIANPNLSFSMNGQWKPGSSGQLYFSDLLNDTYRRYFTHIKTDSWDVKAGDFSLAWQGLIAPKSSLGNLRVARNDNDRSYCLYAWEPVDGEDSALPFGLEANLGKNTRISLLSESLADYAQTVWEWDYQTDLKNGFKWSNALACNISDPSGYGLGLSLDRFQQKWNFTSNLQILNQISDYIDKKRLHLALYQPLAEESLTIHNQFIYESRALEEADPSQPSSEPSLHDYDDYNLETVFHWPSGLKLHLSHQRQLRDNLFSKDNTSLFLEDSFEIERYQNEWWLSCSLDHFIDGESGNTKISSNYAKLNWNTKYALSQNEDLILNPQIVSNSAASGNESKIGFGYRRRFNYNSVELKSLFYQYLTSKKSLDFSLDWRIYQYQLSFKYVGIWNDSDYATDTFSLTFRKKFSAPVQKPWGAVEGTAFIDRNRNGVFDAGEAPLRKAILVLDGNTAFETDENGHYVLYGLPPGAHQLTLDPLYEVIYLPETPVTLITVKQYQTIRLDLPFIRSQNVTGVIYFDKNMNGIQEEDELTLSGIPVVLKNVANKEIARTYSNRDGQFTFYQLAPDSYRIVIDENLLPDNMQPPPGTATIAIDSGQLEELAPLKIGLIPFERPINIIKESAKIWLTLDKELIKTGETIAITVESALGLKNLELDLPTGEKVPLDTSSNKKSWVYLWKIPDNAPTGQVKIKCNGVDVEGQGLQEEAILIIIPG